MKIEHFAEEGFRTLMSATERRTHRSTLHPAVLHSPQTEKEEPTGQPFIPQSFTHLSGPHVNLSQRKKEPLANPPSCSPSLTSEAHRFHTHQRPRVPGGAARTPRGGRLCGSARTSRPPGAVYSGRLSRTLPRGLAEKQQAINANQGSLMPPRMEKSKELC